MSSHEFIDVLEKIKLEPVNRLDHLLQCKNGNVSIQYDDIEERISQCIVAIDGIDKAIVWLRSNSR